MQTSFVKIEPHNDFIEVIVTESKIYQNVMAPLRDQLVDVLDTGEKKILLNLSKVELVNSSGLGVLLLIWDRLKKDGGKLILYGLTPVMEEIFERMRLDTIFIIEKDFESARRKFLEA